MGLPDHPATPVAVRDGARIPRRLPPGTGIKQVPRHASHSLHGTRRSPGRRNGQRATVGRSRCKPVGAGPRLAGKPWRCLPCGQRQRVVLDPEDASEQQRVQTGARETRLKQLQGTKGGRPRLRINGTGKRGRPWYGFLGRTLRRGFQLAPPGAHHGPGRGRPLAALPRAGRLGGTCDRAGDRPVLAKAQKVEVRRQLSGSTEDQHHQ